MGRGLCWLWGAAELRILDGFSIQIFAPWNKNLDGKSIQEQLEGRQDPLLLVTPVSVYCHLVWWPHSSPLVTAVPL